MVAMLGPVSTWEDRGVERSGTLPNDWYTSRELFDLEQRTLFREIWHCVGRVEQVAEPGQYFVTEVADEQVVVVARPGRRAARAVQRLPAPRRPRGGGLRQAQRLPVPVPRLDVRARRPRPQDAGHGRHRGLRAAAHAAAAVPGRARGARRSGSRSSRRSRSSEWLGDVTPRLANYRIDEMRFAGGRRWTIGCNWKMYVDNYMEGYHIPFIHPGLAQSLSPTIYTYRLGALLQRAVRRRAAPARPGLARGRHPRRDAGVPPPQAGAATASTSPSARATTSTGSSR